MAHVHAKDTAVNYERLYECGIYGDSVGNKDYGFGERWWRYTIPGSGDVDWNLMVTRLEDFGYDDPLSIELEDQRFWATRRPVHMTGCIFRSQRSTIGARYLTASAR